MIETRMDIQTFNAYLFTHFQRQDNFPLVRRYLERHGRVIDRDVDPSGHPRQLYRLPPDPESRGRGRGTFVIIGRDGIVEVEDSVLQQMRLFVLVCDSTTAQNYALEVHPELFPMTPNGDYDRSRPQEPTCHNAVASTFGLTGEEYAPVAES